MKEVLPERRTAPSRDGSCRNRMARTPREASRPKVLYIRLDDELETLDMKPGIQDHKERHMYIVATEYRRLQESHS